MKCKFIKTNGETCNANPIKGSEYCFSHDPDKKEDKKKAVIKGGKNRRTIAEYGKTMKLETAKDIKKLIGETINLVWTGQMPANQPANSIGFLARVFLDANEQSDMEERIKNLEDTVENYNKK
jgi:hypothetical protein